MINQTDIHILKITEPDITENWKEEEGQILSWHEAPLFLVWQEKGLEEWRGVGRGNNLSTPPPPPFGSQVVHILNLFSQE